jgi:hypothetical protein
MRRAIAEEFEAFVEKPDDTCVFISNADARSLRVFDEWIPLRSHLPGVQEKNLRRIDLSGQVPKKLIYLSNPKNFVIAERNRREAGVYLLGVQSS